MKNDWRGLTSVILVCLFVSAPLKSLAAQTPSDLVKEMLSRVKSEKNYAVMLDYVHWPSVYQNLKVQPDVRKRFNSPQELKEYFSQAIDDPEKMIREEMEKRLEALPDDKKPQMKAFVEQQLEKVKKEKARLQQDIETITFEVGKEVVNGNKARVEVAAVRNKKKEVNYFELELIDGKWYLPSMNLGKFAKKSGFEEIS